MRNLDNRAIVRRFRRAETRIMWADSSFKQEFYQEIAEQWERLKSVPEASQSFVDITSFFENLKFGAFLVGERELSLLGQILYELQVEQRSFWEATKLDFVEHDEVLDKCLRQKKSVSHFLPVLLSVLNQRKLNNFGVASKQRGLLVPMSEKVFFVASSTIEEVLEASEILPSSIQKIRMDKKVVGKEVGVKKLLKLKARDVVLLVPEIQNIVELYFVKPFGVTDFVDGLAFNDNEIIYSVDVSRFQNNLELVSDIEKGS